jgi:hypothetical protein
MVGRHSSLSPTQRCAALAVATGLAVLLAAGQARAAGGAYAVDDVEIGKPGECKVESFGQGADNRDSIFATVPACVFDLFRPVEVSSTIVRFRQDGEMGSGLTLKGKTNILPATVGRMGLGASGSVAFDLLTDEFVAAFWTGIGTYKFTEQFKLNLNAGWLYDRPIDQHLFFWGAGLEWSPIEKWTLIGEVFGFVGDGVNNEPRVQAGLRYTPMDAFDIDLIYGYNLTGERANWVTLGLNVRFDAVRR